MPRWITAKEFDKQVRERHKDQGSAAAEDLARILWPLVRRNSGEAEQTTAATTDRK